MLQKRGYHDLINACGGRFSLVQDKVPLQRDLQLRISHYNVSVTIEI